MENTMLINNKNIIQEIHIPQGLYCYHSVLLVIHRLQILLCYTLGNQQDQEMHPHLNKQLSNLMLTNKVRVGDLSILGGLNLGPHATTIQPVLQELLLLMTVHQSIEYSQLGMASNHQRKQFHINVIIPPRQDKET